MANGCYCNNDDDCDSGVCRMDWYMPYSLRCLEFDPNDECDSDLDDEETDEEEQGGLFNITLPSWFPNITLPNITLPDLFPDDCADDADDGEDDEDEGGWFPFPDLFPGGGDDSDGDNDGEEQQKGGHWWPW